MGLDLRGFVHGPYPILRESGSFIRQQVKKFGLFTNFISIPDCP
jgi:hypothetical protein